MWTNPDLLLHWLVIVCYGLGTLAVLYGLAFDKPKWLNYSVAAAAVGVAAHTLALGIRWYLSGHGPFLVRFEIFSAYVLLGMYMYLLLQYRKPALKVVGALVLPLALIILGAAMTASPAHKALPPTFNVIWISLHIIFAQVSYGAAVLGSGLALLYLLKQRAQNRQTASPLFQRLPDLEELDRLSCRFNTLAFLTLAVMLTSGAVWANYLWGKYWSWDPIENWSLISWLLYGIYLHLRRIHGWRGAKAAWFSFLALVVLVFILAGVGWVYDSSHAQYLG